MSFAYIRSATNNFMPVGMNHLSDLIVRPGIQKRLWPLCLYRGAMSPGLALRRWNFALLMMAAEAETLADGLKLAHNPAFAQLCGPVRRPEKVKLNGFFGRLWDNPDVTDNISGFTDYVRSLELGPSNYQRVELETDRQFCAPWRISTHPDFDKHAEKPESGTRALYYPYLAHNPDNDEGASLVLLANQLVPSYLPDQVRADVCQDLIIGMLSGDIAPERAQDFVAKYVRNIYKLHPIFFEQGFRITSLNKPINHDHDAPALLEKI